MSKYTTELEEKVNQLQQSLGILEKKVAEQHAITKHASIMVSSNDFDKLMMALNLAVTAAASGIEVSLFFSFWGVQALKKETIYTGKTWTAKLMSWLFSAPIDDLKLSKLHYFGLGKWAITRIMKKNNMPPLSTLIKTAQEMDIKLIACIPSLQLFGIKNEELVEGVSLCGATPFMIEASHSQITWVI